MKDIRSKGERYFFEEKMMERNESSNILFNFRFLSCISGFISGNISIYHFLSIIFLSIISLIKSKKSIKESIYDHKTLHPLSTILCNLGGQWKISIRNKGEHYFFEEKIMERNESSNVTFDFYSRIFFWKYFHPHFNWSKKLIYNNILNKILGSYHPIIKF